MDNYEPGVYTEKVLEATKLLSNTGKSQLLPRALNYIAYKCMGNRILMYLWNLLNTLFTYYNEN